MSCPRSLQGCIEWGSLSLESSAVFILPPPGIFFWQEPFRTFLQFPSITHADTGGGFTTRDSGVALPALCLLEDVHGNRVFSV